MNSQNFDQLIFELAEFNNKAEDVAYFYKNFLLKEFFFSLSEDLFKTRSKPTSKKKTLTTPLAKLENGMNVVVFYTTKNDSRLGKKYGGIIGYRGLEMVLKMNQADGLIVQNKNSSWFGMDRKQVEYLYQEYIKDN